MTSSRLVFWIHWPRVSSWTSSSRLLLVQFSWIIRPLVSSLLSSSRPTCLESLAGHPFCGTGFPVLWERKHVCPWQWCGRSHCTEPDYDHIWARLWIIRVDLLCLKRFCHQGMRSTIACTVSSVGHRRTYVPRCLEGFDRHPASKFLIYLVKD